MIRTTDKRTRQRSIPFRPMWFDSSSIGNTFISGGQISGDLSVLQTGIGAGGQIRYCRPEKGELTEAYLTMNAVAPVQSPTELRFYIGSFQADGITPATPSAARIAEHHKILTGRNSPYFYGSQANIFIAGLNLMRLIPQRGDAEFNSDAFIIGVEISAKAPNEWVLWDFIVDCSVSLAEVVRNG